MLLECLGGSNARVYNTVCLHTLTFTEAQLKIWRRGFKTPPPPVSSYSLSYPGNDFRRTKYVKDLRISLMETINRSIEAKELQVHRKFPKAESLWDCVSASEKSVRRAFRVTPRAVTETARVHLADATVHSVLHREDRAGGGRSGQAHPHHESRERHPRHTHASLRHSGRGDDSAPPSQRPAAGTCPLP